MKKRTTKSTAADVPTGETMEQIHRAGNKGRLTVGLDLGDRNSDYCILDEDGEVLIRGTLATTTVALDRVFGKMPASRIAMEVGTHSPWVSRRLKALGHEVIVANPRNVAWITQSRKKDDRIDAEKLARLARVDVKLLSPVQHRGEQGQRDLMVIRARAGLVEARTQLINAVRGLVKSVGERLEGCDSEKVGTEMAGKLSEATAQAVKPLLESIEKISEQIAGYEKQLEKMKERYPETELLTAVYGVGTLVALTFVLTIEDAKRFSKSRDVGAYLGMVPSRRESGEREPELRITKEGDRHLRWMLVQSAHCILRKGGPDSDLRRWGLKQLDPVAPSPHMAGNNQGKQKTGKNRKKRVLVAVARRLAVLLHHLWSNGEVYDPLYGAKQAALAQAKAKAKAEGKAVQAKGKAA